MRISLLVITSLLATTLKAQTYHWAKSLGGPSDEWGQGIDVDASGNVYTSGWFNGTADFDPGPGTYNLISNGGQEVFVQKMNTSGNLVWAKSFGGTSSEYCHSIAVDASGNVYTAGTFSGTVDFDPGPGISTLTTPVGYNNIFVQKMDASGNFVWARNFAAYEALTIAVDAFGDVYTAGDFGGTVDFDPGSGVFNLTGSGSYDVFIQKMDASGNFIWARSLGGTASDFCHSITTDAFGNVYTTGTFGGTADFDPGSGTANSTSVGGDDVFVHKMNASGNLIWVKTFGGTSHEHAQSVAVDASGNVYSTGSFYGPADFDPGSGTSILNTGNTFEDIFIHKMDASGNFQWVKTFGGTNTERGNSLTTDASGNVYTTGWFLGTADFDPGPGVTNLSSYYNDVFIQKMDASGNFQWAKSSAGMGSELGFSIAVDTSNNVFTTGWFTGTADFNPGPGTANLTSAGGSDVFVQKLRQCLPSSGTDVVSTCGPYTWINGNTYVTSNNTATHVLTNVAGCDSIVTLNLTILSNTGTDVQNACNSYTWIDGNTYVASNNTATYTLTNSAGCDSVVTLNLTINSNTGTDVIAACNSYDWIDGNTYTESNNTATHTLINSSGCDSVITLNLTINHSNTGTDTITACDSYDWIDGNTYTTSNNTATHILVNAAGCDSVVTLNLTITHSNTGTAIITACDSYEWIDGNTYTSSTNTPTFVLQNAAGCDSTVTLNLTITHSTSGTDVQTACSSYDWIDGNTYTASNNTATYTLTNAAGCDSVVTLNLTINSNSGTDIITACDSYRWINGVTYTASNNTATFTLTNAAGCDSVITLDLTINSVSDITTVLSGIHIHANNANATYQWLDCNNNYAVINGATNQDFTATVNGNYAVQLTENGCIDTSACVEIKTVGIPDADFENGIMIYPNPTDGNFSINLGSLNESAEISISDLTGKLIYKRSAPQKQVLSISLTEPSGFYFIRVHSGEKIAVFKLIKK